MGHRRRSAKAKVSRHTCAKRDPITCHCAPRLRIVKASEKVGRGPGRVFLACDAQGVFAAAVGLGFAARTGSSRRNVEPLPTLDSTQMRPPCISTICLAMARPRPVPPLALVLELST